MPRKSRKNVGLIGLGIIGTRAAAGLRAAGFHVFVWNRSPKAAPNFLASPADVAGMCEIIQLFVADAKALFDVIEQMSEALTSRHLVICNATVGPEATLEAARLVEARGAAFLDAPFTGSKSAAENRELVYYVGGDDASCLRARPVLEATSRNIVRIGGVGHAATVKVVTNMISAVSTQTLAEALAIVQKAGLDPEVLAAALEHNACRSPLIGMKLPKMIAGDYEPHFSLKHMFKDVQLGIHVANALDIEIPATTVAAGVMYGALNQGFGELDFSSIYKVYDPQIKSSSAALRTPSPQQLGDLDRKNEHYRETHVAAPPRPAPRISKIETPRFSDVLNAPGEAKPGVPTEPVAPGANLSTSEDAKPPDASPTGSDVGAAKLSAAAEGGLSSAGADDASKAKEQPLAEVASPAGSLPDQSVSPEISPKSPESPESRSEKDLPEKVTVVASRELASADFLVHPSDDEPGLNRPRRRPMNFVRRWFVPPRS